MVEAGIRAPVASEEFEIFVTTPVAGSIFAKNTEGGELFLAHPYMLESVCAIQLILKIVVRISNDFIIRLILKK